MANRKISDLEDEAANVLTAVQRGKLVLEWKLLRRPRHVDDQVDRFDLGGQQVLAVRGWVVFHDNLAVSWVDNELALDWQVTQDVSPDSRASTKPSHVDSHVTEQFHVQAASTHQDDRKLYIVIISTTIIIINNI